MKLPPMTKPRRALVQIKDMPRKKVRAFSAPLHQPVPSRESGLTCNVPSPKTAPPKSAHAVCSAQVGYFFKAKNVSCSCQVKKGQRLGAVTMLGMEFPVYAHYDGWVDTIVVACGMPVDYGQCLILLRPN